MKKLLIIISLLSISTASQATMFRTLTVQVYMSDSMLCMGGYDGDNLGKLSDFLESVRYETGPEGDAVDRSFSKFFVQEDHAAYWAGKDIKKAGLPKDTCKAYAQDRLRQLAIKTGNADFITDNPDMFGK
ncbi:hypothetical protein [Rahnella variigena]|nr:hypothetical protein [Rahnella variigena]TCQ83168.1 hypothetical protein EC840_1195 [Rahnella sp. JUb53]